jgi:hypothetical protein
MTEGVGVPNATANRSRRMKDAALSIISRVRPEKAPAAQPDEHRRGPLRRALSVLLTVLAAVLVYLALIVPDSIAHHKAGLFVPGAFLRLPLEGLLGGAILIAVPARFRRPVAALLGLGLGGLAVLKILNAGFLTVLGRRFNPVLDWSLFHDGFNALTETNGRATAIAAAIGAVLLSVALLTFVSLAVVRLGNVTARYAGPARRALVALSAVWVALALTGVTLYQSNPVAADSALVQAKTTVQEIPAAIRDEQAFNKAAANDPFANVPPKQRLAGLAGKDFIISVVESYGRSALTNPGMKAIVDPVLTQGTQTLAAKGYYAKSGFLNSSTYGGGSWLAHGSFQSGLWINSQPRYRQLTASNRLTITSAFHAAGWQTVGMEPGNTTAWPEAKFYGYDSVYDSRNMGYKGPRFGWSRMPDQYTFAQFEKIYGKPHAPLMAEITMTSSHEPWTAIPQMVNWDQIGDGSLYGPMAAAAPSKSAIWSNHTVTQAQYAKSIAYSVSTLVSWIEKYGDKNLVMVFFGDHQPFSIVSGDGANHQVPITIVAHDKTVLDRIANWNWTDGLEPAATAPVWQMSDFRDKFFSAYGSEPEVKQAR